MCRYVKGTKNVTLELKVDKSKAGRVTGHTDTDWAACKLTRKSTSCGIVK